MRDRRSLRFALLSSAILGVLVAGCVEEGGDGVSSGSGPGPLTATKVADTTEVAVAIPADTVSADLTAQVEDAATPADMAAPAPAPDLMPAVADMAAPPPDLMTPGPDIAGCGTGTPPVPIPPGSEMKCDKTTRPGNLPDPSKCKGMMPMDCNGWTPSGPPLGAGDVIFGGPAQLYTWQMGDILCLYLFRDTMPTANGVLCFNVKTCEVCPYDGSGTAPGADIGTMEHPPDDNCGVCHRTGPLLPMEPLFSMLPKMLRDQLKSLMKTCSNRGGPIWRGTDQTVWPPGDPCKVIKPPMNCNGCHNGFNPGQRDAGAGRDFCTIIKESFSSPNGSMSGNQFASEADCKNFMNAMGCPELASMCKGISAP